MGRLLARIGLSDRICKDCKYFSVADGQQEIAKAKVFHAVSQHVSPAMMMRAKQIEAQAKLDAAAKKEQAEAEAADPVLEAERIAREAVDAEFPPEPAAAKPSVPDLPAPMQQVKWEEFGKCSKHNRLDWQGNTCPSWA